MSTLYTRQLCTRFSFLFYLAPRCPVHISRLVSARAFSDSTQQPTVRIVEVGPRDGLQNEPRPLDTDVKVKLIELLSRTGLRVIEATSFVSPRAIPQLADATMVMQRLKRAPGVKYTALVPNLKGLETALKCKMDEVAVFGAASETFSRKNINCTIAESIKRFKEVTNECKKHNMPVRGYVSCVAGCPYEGDVPPERVAEVSRALFEMGCYEISLGDTIGIGRPPQIARMLEAVTNPALGGVPLGAIALHCHDTYSRALINIRQAYQMGVRVFDSSVAGLGGCPYAKGATGNVATEAVVQLMHSLGARTNIDLKELHSARDFITKFVTPKKPVETNKTNNL